MNENHGTRGRHGKGRSGILSASRVERCGLRAKIRLSAKPMWRRRLVVAGDWSRCCTACDGEGAVATPRFAAYAIAKPSRNGAQPKGEAVSQPLQIRPTVPPSQSGKDSASPLSRGLTPISQLPSTNYPLRSLCVPCVAFSPFALKPQGYL